MASSISCNLISFIGIGNRPSTSPSFSCGNEVPTLVAVLVRAPPRKNLRRTGLPGSLSIVSALERSNSGGDSCDGKNGGVSNSNYVVPLDKSFPISNSPSKTRTLAEIQSDLKRNIPDNIVKADVRGTPPYPLVVEVFGVQTCRFMFLEGWDGEIFDVIFSNDGSVTVVYIVSLIGSDGKVAICTSTGTVYPSDGPIKDPVAAAEELAFCKACAQLGLGLYLYHED